METKKMLTGKESIFVSNKSISECKSVANKSLSNKSKANPRRIQGVLIRNR